jgi:hypothetical protein
VNGVILAFSFSIIENLLRNKSDIKVDFTMAGETQESRKLGPSINRLTFESIGNIQLALTNLVSISNILIKDLEVELVLARAFVNVKGEGLVPDRVLSISYDFRLLLIVFIQPKFNKRVVVTSSIFLVKVTGFNETDSKDTTGSRERREHLDYIIVSIKDDKKERRAKTDASFICLKLHNKAEVNLATVDTSSRKV